MRSLLAWTAIALSIATGAGSLILFAASPIGTLAPRLRFSDPVALAWDAFLSLAFFVQHSGMVRRGFRDRLARWIPPPYHRAWYSVASGLTLAAVVLLWQPTATRLLTVEGPWLWLPRAAALLAISLFVWGAVAVRDIDFFGVAALRAWLRHDPPSKPVFVVRGPYRWIRHPWYSGVLLLIWSFTELTADRLLFNILWTAWVCLGTVLEERDLLAEFNGPYADYRRATPMFFPRCGADALVRGRRPGRPPR